MTQETLRNARDLAATVADAHEEACTNCHGTGITVGEPVLGGVAPDDGQPCRGCAQTGVVFRVREQMRAYSPEDFIRRYGNTG